MTEREEIAANLRKEARKLAGLLVKERLSQGTYRMAYQVKARLLIKVANDIERGRV